MNRQLFKSNVTVAMLLENKKVTLMLTNTLFIVTNSLFPEENNP